MRRIFGFLTEMEKAPACRSRQEAFLLFKSLWIEVNQLFETPEDDMQLFLQLELCKECGWKDLAADPCYLPSIEHTNVRLYLHHDGTIVLQRMEDDAQPILLFKQGAKALRAPLKLVPAEIQTYPNTERPLAA